MFSYLVCSRLTLGCFLACCLRCDITAILLFVEHLMWSVCEHPDALVHSSRYSATATVAGGSVRPHQIHGLCEELLTVLIIVTAPLSLLHRFVHTDDITFSLLNSCIEIVGNRLLSSGHSWLILWRRPLRKSLTASSSTGCTPSTPTSSRSRSYGMFKTKPNKKKPLPSCHILHLNTPTV